MNYRDEQIIEDFLADITKKAYVELREWPNAGGLVGKTTLGHIIEYVLANTFDPEVSHLHNELWATLTISDNKEVKQSFIEKVAREFISFDDEHYTINYGDRYEEPVTPTRSDYE